MHRENILKISFLVLAFAGLASSQSYCGGIVPSQACQNIFPELYNTTSPLYEEFALLSGRFINDLGQYEACQASNTTHYLTLYFNAVISSSSSSSNSSNNSNSSFQAAIGFCAPLACSYNDITAMGNNVTDLFSATEQFNFTLIQVTGCDLAVYDPTIPQDNEYWTSVLVYIILAFTVSLTIGGTAMNAFYDISDAYSKNDRLNIERLIDDAGRGQALNDKKKREYRGFAKFLDCFDARKNFNKIVHVKQSKDYDSNLEVFNGFRVFFFMYVVYGHCYIFGTYFIDNPSDLYFVANSWWLLIVYAALYSVDAFFFMSGFFVAFLLIGKLKKLRPKVGNFFGLCFHRFFRIWPTYAFAILFFWKILPLLGSGPIWFMMTQTTGLCDQGRVFENLTFTDDLLVESDNYCYGWGWYLSNDFQMFLLTPLFLWLYIWKRVYGKLAIFALICLSWIGALVLGGVLGVSAAPPSTGGITNQTIFAEYYIKPYIRLPPYFLGVLFGLIYKEYKEGEKDESLRGVSYHFFKFSRTLFGKWLFQLGGFALMMYVVLMIRPEQLNHQAWLASINDLVRAFQKSVYVIALAFIILPSLAGEDTMLKRFMSHPLLVPLYRLSFTAYLVHLCWVYRSYFGVSASFHYTNENLLYQCLANGVISFVTALILSILMEVPTSNIEAVYLMRRERPVSVAKDVQVVPGAELNSERKNV